MNLDGVGYIAQIRDDANANAFRHDCITDGIDGIVRDGEAGDLKFAHGKPATRLKAFQPRRDFTPLDRGRGPVGEIDRDIKLLSKRYQSTDMVAVLMRDQNGVQLFDVLADGRQPFSDLAPAQARIDKYTRSTRGDECRVPRTATR